MPMTYSFDVGDPICVEAAAGRLTNMYKILNGYSMSDILKMLDLYQAGELKLDELVTSRYSLEQVNQGYADLVAGKNIRGVIVHG